MKKTNGNMSSAHKRHYPSSTKRQRTSDFVARHAGKLYRSCVCREITTPVVSKQQKDDRDGQKLFKHFFRRKSQRKNWNIFECLSIVIIRLPFAFIGIGSPAVCSHEWYELPAYRVRKLLVYLILASERWYLSLNEPSFSPTFPPFLMRFSSNWSRRSFNTCTFLAYRCQRTGFLYYRLIMFGVHLEYEATKKERDFFVYACPNNNVKFVLLK